jgi:chemotaxis family two-component system response regulator Rcp1
MKNTDYILLIDDDEATRFYHSVMAEEANVSDQILIARNGMEGIDILKKIYTQSPSIHGIIFLDINMPAVDGWEVLSEFEKMNSDFVQNQTLVMVSASDHPSDIEKIVAHPLIHSYMPKPLIAEKIRFLAESV